MYVKLFESILDSTIWQETSDTKVVWITLMAMADRDGIVEASIPGLARRAGVSLEATEAALEIFQRADPYSRTPDHDGKRIEPIPGGYRLINYEAYREKASPENQRMAHAERQRRYRERHRDATVTPGDAPLRPVTPRGGKAEAEAEAEAERKDIREHIRALFDVFVRSTGHSPSLYTLTDKRMAMGCRRFEEALKKTGGDLDKAQELMLIAVNQLVESDYHMARGKYIGQTKYNDWENLFRSQEQFEKWLERSNQ